MIPPPAAINCIVDYLDDARDVFALVQTCTAYRDTLMPTFEKTAWIRLRGDAQRMHDALAFVEDCVPTLAAAVARIDPQHIRNLIPQHVLERVQFLHVDEYSSRLFQAGVGRIVKSVLITYVMSSGYEYEVTHAYAFETTGAAIHEATKVGVTVHRAMGGILGTLRFDPHGRVWAARWPLAEGGGRFAGVVAMVNNAREASNKPPIRHKRPRKRKREHSNACEHTNACIRFVEARCASDPLVV
jgi:hypothetical protein